jgi:cell division protein FtsW
MLNPYRNYSYTPLKNIIYKQFASIDIVLLITVIILTMVGLVTIYSITMHSGNTYLKHQIIRICAGFIALIIAINIPYTHYRGHLSKFLLIGTIIMLVLTLTIGKQVAEARRWAYFFQPAEIAKYTLIIWLSNYFANQHETESSTVSNKNNKYSRFPFLPLIIVGFVIILLLLQPAIGTSVILTMSSLLLFFISGVKIRHLLLISLIGVSIIIISIITVPYAKKRFNDFRSGITYQQKQSKIAIGSGKMFGKGLGEGKQKFFFLPKLHTDFVFSAIAEEFGFIGSFIVLSLFFLLFSKGIKIGLSTHDAFGQLLTAGILFVILQYVIVHLGVALSLLPTTGQPLPFISYGGSALVTNLYAVGIILNISKFRRNKSVSNFIRNRWNGRAHISRTRSR